MWTLFCVFSLAIFSACLGDFYNTQQCIGWKPQHTVDIKEVQGLWHVQEKILHHERTRFTRIAGSCPTVFISEDTSFNTLSTTMNPLYNNFDGTSYGSGYPHYNTEESNPFLPNSGNKDPYNNMNEQDYLKMKEAYDKRTTYSNDHPRWRNGQNVANRGVGDIFFHPNFLNRYLRLHWDDWTSTEYRLRYNLTRPAVWFHIGVGGPSQEYDSHNIKGLVQITKAVGSHLVLTFCHSRGSGKQPELFTAIMSRGRYLPDKEITGIHTLLVDRGLETAAVEKLCNGVNGVKISRITLISGILFVVYFYLSKTLSF